MNKFTLVCVILLILSAIFNTKSIMLNSDSITTLTEDIRILNQQLLTPQEKTVEIFAERIFDLETREYRYVITDAFELDSELYVGH